MRSHSCFPDRLLILNEDYLQLDFQTIRKKGFCRNSRNFLTAGHLVFLGPKKPHVLSMLSPKQALYFFQQLSKVSGVLYNVSSANQPCSLART